MATTTSGVPDSPFTIKPPITNPIQPGAPAAGSFQPLGLQFINGVGTSGSTSLPIAAQTPFGQTTTNPQTGLAQTNTSTAMNFSPQIPMSPSLPLGSLPIPTAPTPHAASYASTQTPFSTAQLAPQTPTPAQQTSVGLGMGGGKAPAGFEYGPSGQLQPVNTAPPAQTNVQTTSNMSQLSNPSTYEDLLNSINSNIQNYSQSAQQSDQELQAQQQLINAISQRQQAQVNSQAFDLNTKGNQLSWYGRGVPQELAQSQYNNVGFGAQVQQALNQLNVTQAQNQESIAQTGLGLQQQNRQIRSQVAQNLVQQLQSEAGLVNQRELAQLPYSNLTADQKYQLDLQYYQATGQMPNFAGTGPSAQFTSMQNNGSTVPTMQPNNILGSDLSTYATDPQYQSKVMNAIGTMPQQMTTPTGIQSWIDQNYKNSPITGQMIMAASSSAGVSPKTLAGILAVESQMGTDRSAGAKLNNPGNWGNSDSAMANGQPTGFGSMQEGVNHVAQWLAQHPAQQGQQNQVGQAVDNSSAIDKVKQYFPGAMANGVRVTNGGLPYVDLGEVPAPMQTAASNRAAALGVKAFSTDAAKGLQSIDTINLALNSLTELSVKQLMPANGGIGTAGNAIKNLFGSLTGTNKSLTDFGVAKDSAIKAVQALAGGQGSGLRLNTGTIEAAVSNLPTMYDSQEVALEKIQKTRDLLYNGMATAFGNPALSNGVVNHEGHAYMPGDTVANSNGQLGVVNQDGTITPQS